LGHTYEAGNYLDVYWIIGFALIYTAAVKQAELSANRSQASPWESESRQSRELENFVSAATLIIVTTVLYLFADNLRGEIVNYVFPMGVIGIGLMGIKEWWSESSGHCKASSYPR
jgi:hypothetical protein